MNLVKTLSILSAGLLSLPLAATAAPVDSHITAATVYSDRAVVTRTAEVDLVAGENSITFGDLPTGIADQSLQFAGHGAVQATVLDVNAVTSFVDSTPNARVKELEDEESGIQKQIRALDDRAGVLGEESDFVKRMLLSSTTVGTPPADGARGGGAPGLSPLEEWQKLYSYSEETLGKIDAELQSIDGRRDELKGKKAAVEAQLEGLRGDHGKTIKVVTVRLSVPAACKLEAALKYTLPGATWAPSYDARLLSGERAVALSYNGLVWNTTGEDWSNIELTLSTARPSLGGGAPELRPWVVDVERRYEAQERAEYSAKSMAGAPLNRTDMKDADSAITAVTRQMLSEPGAANAPALEAFEVQAKVEGNATGATFRIPAAVSIPANNSVQKVSIASARLPADLRYDCTPKLMEAAFLTAAAANTTDYPFLGGAMNTFLDDTFIASSRMKTVMPGEKFDLHLGVDEGISVRRRLVNRFAENSGITGGGRRVTYDILVTITNNKRTTEHVSFKEPLPVSRNEKIEVRLLTPDEGDVGTKEAPKEVTREEDGRLVWRFELAPGAKREIPIRFSVEHPADVSVSGLE
jgi:uncharacterized protein (TIGR02231 family)